MQSFQKCNLPCQGCFLWGAIHDLCVLHESWLGNTNVLTAKHVLEHSAFLYQLYTKLVFLTCIRERWFWCSLLAVTKMVVSKALLLLSISISLLNLSCINFHAKKWQWAQTPLFPILWRIVWRSSLFSYCSYAKSFLCLTLLSL